MNPIRVMLVDDHTVVRAGLKSLLDRQEDMKVVAEADSVPKVLELIRQHHPNVIVLDLTMPGGGSLDLVRTLRSMESPTRVLIFTMHDDPAYARSALAAGAAGYVVKTVGEQDMLGAVRAVSRGQVFIDLDDSTKTAGVYSQIQRPGAGSGLSDRELEVLKFLGQGFSNLEIAEKLDVSPKTVATYKARIAEKVGLKTTADFVKYAKDTGLLDSNRP